MPDTKTEHRGGSGNFAEDRERAAKAGHKGGQQSRGNFAKDREPGARGRSQGRPTERRQLCA
jgi:uncharacterized protein